MGEFREVPQSVKNVNKFARLLPDSHVSFFSDRTSHPDILIVAVWVFCSLPWLDTPSRVCSPPNRNKGLLACRATNKDGQSLDISSNPSECLGSPDQGHHRFALILRADSNDTFGEAATPTRSASEAGGNRASLALRVSVSRTRAGYSHQTRYTQCVSILIVTADAGIQRRPNQPRPLRRHQIVEHL